MKRPMKTPFLTMEPEIFTLFEMTPDLVCIASKEGYFKKVNPAAISKLGYTAEEIYSRPIASFIHPGDREKTAGRRARLLQGETMLNFQNRYITKNGDVIWLEWTSVYLPDKELVFAIAKDITAGKRREEEIEQKYHAYKSMATHFKNRAEENRKYLASELHEEVAQLAAVVKMDIAWLKQHHGSSSETVKNKIEDTLILADLLIRTIRRISFSISPNMLDDLGFTAALQWICKEFALLNGIPCQFTGNGDADALSRETRIDLFRICQEALGNVMEHAEAKEVWVDFYENADSISLSITDNGKGFDIASFGNSAGLQHMDHLAASIGGELELRSEAGKGTMIKVALRKK